MAGGEADLRISALRQVVEIGRTGQLLMHPLSSGRSARRAANTRNRCKAGAACRQYSVIIEGSGPRLIGDDSTVTLNLGSKSMVTMVRLCNQIILSVI